MTDFKPMLAKAPKADADGNPILSYPVLVQAKLDGIRATVVNGKLVSRMLKPIPNAEIRAALERPEFEGFDGELVIGDGTNFQASSSYVMAEGKTGGDWTYWTFDLWNHAGTNTERQSDLIEDHFGPDNAGHVLDDRVKIVKAWTAHSEDDLAQIETACLEQGLEGVIARDPNARYKFGRSSPGKGPLWKIKRFIDFEARVVGVYEEQHNGNVATKNALGRTERSTAKAGKTGKGTLGGLVLVALNGPAKGVEFRCGTGFDAEQRAALWAEAIGGTSFDALDEFVGLNGQIAKVKSFPIGVKDKPRFPVFLGWRDAADFDAEQSA